MNPPRPYANKADFEALLDILVEGGRTPSATYYDHPGDVKWWLSYPDQRSEFGDRIFVWDGDNAPRGVCLFTPADGAYDLFLRPALWSTDEATAMDDWAETHALRLAAQTGHTHIKVGSVAETDTRRTAWLSSRGFTPGEFSLFQYWRDLDVVPEPDIPPGYVIRPTTGEPEAESRALASHSAFKSTWPMDRYMARRLSFMRSPFFSADRDIVVAAPDGRVAAFCIYWLDLDNRVGLFEPVGTHADFQGRGLGKALMLATLRRMRAEGMTRARVCCKVDNPAGNRLYESVGFTRRGRLVWFEKSLRAG